MIKNNFKFINFVLNGFTLKKIEKKCDILFNLENSTHFREAIPIVNSLEKIGKKVIILSININKKNLEFGKEIDLDRENKLSLRYYIFFLINYLFNINYFIFCKHIRKKYRIKNLNKLLKYNKSKYFYYKKYFNYIIQQTKPKCVFIGNDLTFNGRLLTIISKKNNIQTISIQHGNLYDENIQKKHLVDRYFCYSEESLKVLKKSFRGHIIITGSPFINAKYYQLKDLINVSKEYVLIALSGYGHSTSRENYKKQLNVIDKVIKENPKKQFVAKLHPKENVIDYSTIKLSSNIRIIEDNNQFSKESITSLISHAHSIITGVSTVSLEALLLETPVITLDPLFEYLEYDLVKKKISRYLQTSYQLNIAINDTVVDETSFQYANWYYGTNIDSMTTIINELNL